MPNNGDTLKYRVGELEKKVDVLVSNHIPHIQAEINEFRIDVTKEINGLRIEITRNTAKVGIILAVAFSIIQVAINNLF